MATTLIDQPAVKSGTFNIGGALTVVRLGFGAMRLTCTIKWAGWSM